MNKNGFTVIEFLVYFMLTVMLTMLLNQAALYIHQHTKSHMVYCSTWLQAMTAIDLLSQDVETSSYESVLWKKLSEHELIMPGQRQVDIGWSVYKNNLVRIVGSFNKHLNTWHHKRRTIVLKGVSKASFKVERTQKSVVAITLLISFNIDTASCDLDRRVMIKNRVVPC